LQKWKQNGEVERVPEFLRGFRMKKKCGIYIIQNIHPDGGNKKYIGQSEDIERRWDEHLKALKNNKHGLNKKTGQTDHLQHAWNKYGGESFTFHILKLCKPEELSKLEKQYVWDHQSFNPNGGYNRTPGGEKYDCPDEVREKLSKANSGRIHTDQSRKNMSDAHKGIPNSRKGLLMPEKQYKSMEKVWKENGNKARIKLKGRVKYGDYKEEWKELYFNQGHSFNRISSMYNVSIGAVRNVLKTCDIDLSIGKELREQRKKEDLRMVFDKNIHLKNEILECYKKDLSFTMTAERFNISRKAVARYVREEEEKEETNIVRKDIRYRKRKHLEFTDQWIKEYNNGSSSIEIAKQYNTKPHIVRGVLKREKVKMRSSTDKSHTLKPHISRRKYMCFLNEWIDLKDNGNSYKAIGRLYNIDNSIVRDYILKYSKEVVSGNAC
jgi:group I intron endonuclease